VQFHKRHFIYGEERVSSNNFELNQRFIFTSST